MNNMNSKKVFEFLRESITNGRWKDGERITPEIQLSKELGVSRNSVREAIEKLVGMGFLDKKKGKGTYLKSNTIDHGFNDMLINTILKKDDYIDILTFRKTFEPENVRLFIENASDIHYNELIKNYDKMKKYVEDKEKFSFYDAEFHHIIAKGTQNTIIIKISEVLFGIMVSHQKNLNILLGSDSGVREHKLIIDSICEKDKDLAYFFMRKHIIRTIKDVQQVINKK
ncbi:FadR/GntR family transcriptional regulator [Fusobacterium sp. PH5-44]|uniref:FadR/GntR family transcriptional regulator n=1 Tax=unclassified Fusobacterium TaxID=2648384 RepID=UPI003D1A59A3